MKYIRTAKFAFLFVLLVSFLQTGCKRNPEEPIFEDDTLEPLYFDHLAWHPAGEWIAVEHGDSVDSDKDGKLDAYFGGIWLVDAQTGKTQHLLRGFTLPAWSPDGKRLALVRGAQIYTIDVISLKPARVDSSSLRQLTFEGGNFFPAWSPDGQWIAFDSNYQDSVGAHVIWIIKSDGTELRDISKHRVGEWRMPAWSKDSLIVYVRFLAGIESGQPELFVMDRMGNTQKRITYQPDWEEFYPSVSKQDLIVFNTKPRIGLSGIAIIDLDGTEYQRLTAGSDYRPTWSPDGQGIAFVRWNFLNAVPGNGQIWLINADGTGLRQLTFFQRRR